jgi:integrase
MATTSELGLEELLANRQVGNIAVSGKWYVVRFWKYPVGQQRVHASERICLVDPAAAAYLPKGERRRRATEIVEASGVNDAQTFVEATTVVTFGEQAGWFMNHSATRKRNPVKAATVQAWQNTLNKWLVPSLGGMPLASVSNGTVKPLVQKMNDAGLSAKSILNYFGLVKLIVGSAVDKEGDQMFPRKWNHEFLDLPMVSHQHQPSFDTETMSRIVANASGQDGILYALLAGTGLRVGEALGLEIKHLSEDRRSITVEQSCWEGQLQTPKTSNAYRQIDLTPALAVLVDSFVHGRQAGLLFANRAGKPLSQTNVARRSLHPILAELGKPKAGFHAMRRFRATWLRKQRAPEDLIKFWLGHAKQSVTDEYSQLHLDLEFRREVAGKVGLGFEIPTGGVGSMIPTVPRISGEQTAGIAS